MTEALKKAHEAIDLYVHFAVDEFDQQQRCREAAASDHPECREAERLKLHAKGEAYKALDLAVEEARQESHGWCNRELDLLRKEKFDLIVERSSARESALREILAKSKAPDGRIRITVDFEDEIKALLQEKPDPPEKT